MLPKQTLLACLVLVLLVSLVSLYLFSLDRVLNGIHYANFISITVEHERESSGKWPTKLPDVETIARAHPGDLYYARMLRTHRASHPTLVIKHVDSHHFKAEIHYAWLFGETEKINRSVP